MNNNLSRLNSVNTVMVPMHSLPSPGQATGHHLGYQYVEAPPSPKSRKNTTFNPKYMPPLDGGYRMGYKPLFKREVSTLRCQPPALRTLPDLPPDPRRSSPPEDRYSLNCATASSPATLSQLTQNDDPFKYEVSSPTPSQTPYEDRKASAPSMPTAPYNYTTEPPRKRGYSAPQNKSMISMVPHMHHQTSSRATIKKARRAYRSKFTQEQDRLIISMKNENKTWQEIKEMVKGETTHNIQRRYEVLMAQMNGNLIWEQDDLDALVDLLEAAERHKWKHISSELSRKLDKKVTPLACQKKFKEMFGVAENSSLLGSSLCYAYYDNGWNCVE